MGAACDWRARATIEVVRLLDSRRLTGPSVMHRAPSVIVEVAFDPGDHEPIAAWERELARIFSALGWGVPEPLVRSYKGGAALAFAAPIDVLMPATDVNEWAVASATEIAAGRPALEIPPLTDAIAAVRNPALLALIAAAGTRGVPYLLDDDELTLGMGRTAMSWPREGELPPPSEVAWSALGSIPVALITGTNGKTTSTRLVARIARAAGLRAGSTSTDGIAIDGKLVESGDYTGPAGALAVLRRPDVDVAVLETARGGILRRGLAVSACDAALITNVSSDHLGDYGIDDVETMARVKAVVVSVARGAVLNAEDPLLARIQHPNIAWFSVEPRAHAWTIVDGTLTKPDGTPLVRVEDVPITFGGKARYNIENALGAAALASMVGLPDAAIVDGLRAFTSSFDDNPGRGNLMQLPSGTRVLVDFGHNPAGIERVLAFARALAGEGPVTVISGMPGDRPDDELREVAAQIARAQPRRVFLRDLEGYLRGREPGSIPAILRASLAANGVRIISDTTGEIDALVRALADARADELIVILPSIDGESVLAHLRAQGATWCNHL